MIQATKNAVPEENIDDKQLKQGVEKLHEIAGVDVNYEEWNEVGDIAENGHFDTCEEILKGLDNNTKDVGPMGDYVVYYDAKKNITTFDVSNHEYRLTEYKAILSKGELNEITDISVRVL